MKSVVDEYIWNESDETVVYERDGVEKRFTVSPNMILTRMCHIDTDRYLIGKLEGAGEEYERYLEYLKGGYCNWVEVLAVGRRRDWSKAEQKKYKVAKRWTIPVEVGDFALMPERDKWSRMWRYIWGKDYLHIAEWHIPILIIRKEDSNE